MADDLSTRVAHLEERLDALEHARTQPAAPAEPGEDEGRFWALDGLAARTGRPDGAGAVMLVGDVEAPGGEQARWQYALTTDDVLALTWSDLAGTFAALGHPVRLELLRAILHGTRTARALAAELGLGTTGQIYHHLRELQSAGWLRATTGGEHVVPAERLVPLLAIVLGGLR